MRALAALVAVAGLILAGGDQAAGLPKPPPDARWQYQLESKGGERASGGIDVDICRAALLGGPACVQPTVIDFDLYREEPGEAVNDKPNVAAVRALHDRGGYAVCYVDAGSVETFRPDYRRFRRWHRRHGRSLLGKPFSARFSDEYWANIGGRRQRAFLLAMMKRRTAKCARAGFDAIEFDVVNAWSEGKAVTGWRISAGDQLAYNRALARIAHRRDLAVGLKNDGEQIEELIDHFDFAINEECFTYRECDSLLAFVEAGKPVYTVEYELAPARFCATAKRLGFNSIKKARDFSLFARPYTPCT
jgi:endo-alpha-1,4-polygalactosaminidase (GH114 family)